MEGGWNWSFIYQHKLLTISAELILSPQVISAFRSFQKDWSNSCKFDTIVWFGCSFLLIYCNSWLSCSAELMDTQPPIPYPEIKKFTSRVFCDPKVGYGNLDCQNLSILNLLYPIYFSFLVSPISISYDVFWEKPIHDEKYQLGQSSTFPSRACSAHLQITSWSLFLFFPWIHIFSKHY